VERRPLGPMAEDDLADLNTAVAGGRVRYEHGGVVETPLRGALATLDGSSAYRVEDGVPHLLPGLRILRRREGDAAPGEASRVAGNARRADMWAERSRQWSSIRPPLRPALEDIALVECAAGEALGESRSPAPRILLLGVTPEIATMGRPPGSTPLALDYSPAMIRNVWPSHAAGAAVALADWSALPTGDATYDVVIGDGVLSQQRYPDDYAALAREVRRVLPNGGTLITRVFARPERPDRLDCLFRDLHGGLIHGFDTFRWRLLRAVHRDLESGARLADAWEAWHAHVPDPAGLMRTLGWGPHAVQILDGYRVMETTLSFPTVAEVRGFLADDFEQAACHVPGYEDGNLYPTLVFRAPARRPSPILNTSFETRGCANVARARPARCAVLPRDETTAQADDAGRGRRAECRHRAGPGAVRGRRAGRGGAARGPLGGGRRLVLRGARRCAGPTPRQADRARRCR